MILSHRRQAILSNAEALLDRPVVPEAAEAHQTAPRTVKTRDDVRHTKR